MRSVVFFALAALSSACAGEPTPAAKPVATDPPAAPVATPSSIAPVARVAEPTVERRVAICLGRRCGSDVTTTYADGAMIIAFEVLENGRGPKVDARLRLAPDGAIASFEAKGHHTMGTLVDETFTRDGQRARWKSEEEKGERDVAGSAFFMPIADLPDSLGLLAQALLHAGGSMRLLPDGEARIEKTVEATVRANDRERHLVGYAITGLDLLPRRVWMNDDGTWFGVVSPWESTVPDGWESAVAPLIEIQERLERERGAKLASTYTHKPPAEGLAYTHARVLDVERGRYLNDQTVVIKGEAIAAVGPSSTVKIPAGAEVVDLIGKTILPGLWDMHAHLGDESGVLDIASGVTTARDVGNDPDKLDDFKRSFDAGTAIGPHVLRFGFIEGRNEKAASSKVTAETEEEARAAVEFFAKRAYDGVKIYNSMKPELVPLLAKEAHARGMAVTGHVPVHMLAHEAVRAGYDGIEHVNMLFLNFFADHDTDTRTTKRFTLVGDNAASFDLKSKPVKDFVGLLRDRHVVIDPTLGAFEDLLVGQPGKTVPGLEPVISRLPVQAQRTYLMGGLPLGGKEALYRASFDKLLAMVKLLADQKVTVVTGTDALAGLMLHHELALFVRAGITPAVALRTASLDAARAMKQDAKTGSITTGKAADLFVVEGDPLAHIEDAGKVVSTVRGGVVFPSAPLYQALSVRP